MLFSFLFFFLTKFNNNKLVHIKKYDTNYTLYPFHNPLQTFYLYIFVKTILELNTFYIQKFSLNKTGFNKLFLNFINGNLIIATTN